MKKRSIISLAIAVMVFTTLVFHFHKEMKAASSKSGQTEIDVTITSTDGQLHGMYNVSLINITQHNVTGFLQMKSKIGVYPSLHGGNFPFLRDDWFVLIGCSDERWGFLQSEPFQMEEGETLRFTFIAGSNCPQHPFKFE